MASTQLPVTAQLLKLALPLVLKSGFSAQTLIAASRELPSVKSQHNGDGALSMQTLNALFPSPPPIPLSKRRSMSREELRADAQGRMGEKERTGPAKALFEAWLVEGRRQMVEGVHRRGDKGDLGVREGLRDRLRYNEPVLDNLTEALALLGTRDVSALSAPTTLLPFASPAPHFAHVARIAHDLAQATGDESQGVQWYAIRARLGTIYGVAESHLLSPSHPAAHRPPAERLEATFEVVDRMLERSRRMGDSVTGTGEFLNWVGKSWAGMGRSLGL